jgi:phospholipid/cholesterol/gamma-HCH transport system substrate-binding protein
METKARYILVGLFAFVVLAAGFGFVYWLNNNGGLTARALYKIRFEGPTSGLQNGAAVQFNGIRVGEVTSLQLDPDNPGQITATIAVATGTPMRADTKVSMEFRGLMGSPAISLRGGSPAAPLLPVSATEPAVLVANPLATQDLTQTARQALQHLDKILEDNSDSIKNTMDNLKVFSEALGRNSNRIDAIMAGLEHMTGGSPEKPKPVYDLAVPKTALTAPSRPHKQFVVAEPTAVNALETQRMLARSDNGEISILGEAQWSDTLPKLIQEKIIQSFENAGFLTDVSAAGEPGANTYQLTIELRSFAIKLNPGPAAEVEFSAKLIGEKGRIVSAQLFHATAAASGMDTPAIVAAFNQAFGETVKDLVIWGSRSL